MLNKYFLLSFFLFLSFDQKINAEFGEAKSVPIAQPQNEIDSNALQAHKEKNLKEQVKKKLIDSLSANDKALFEESFAQAPATLKALIYALLNNEEFAMRFKNILLTGQAGSGKSTLAEAIAYILGREYIVIHAPDLLGHYRDQAAENLRKVFQQIAQDKEKPILIINEINALTDGYTSEHGDTQHTAMQLWTLLDKYKNDKDFLLIATTNVTKKMPHQLQSRFEGKTFSIDNPSFESRRRAIEFYLKRLKLERDTTCTDSYLNELAAKTNDFSRRSIEALVDYSLLLYAVKNPNVPKRISKEYLDASYAELIRQKQEFWDFSEHITDEERRHRENLAQAAKHAEESKDLQIKLAEWHLIYRARLQEYGIYSDKWYNIISAINYTKSIVFPNKKPAATIAVVKEGDGWFGPRETQTLGANR